MTKINKSELMTRAWEIKKESNSSLKAAMIVSWSEAKETIVETKTASMTVSKEVVIGSLIVCEPNKWAARYEREVYRVLTTPKFNYSHDEEADYSYYSAKVERVA